ncbi:phosphatidate cytidylyltransferase [Paludicola sp. MB14-C6]|uniref:phosphatidate cytidylyltransferase n=1 Tax=Paludihabitans sp. MB14-C6 TaxID=3070656 RepID=UPI0027DDED16|nr:phosphatidate cytidylyltransferase [Paludicola sp. MB14-C6]WMJ23642.1 phosphatidate cytidylyltransferase [Paludicola sp. MB14-C6]
MKQRLITAGVGLLLFFVILFFFETFLFNAVVAILSTLVVYELLLAYKLTKHKLLSLLSCTFAALVPMLVTKEKNAINIIAIIVFTGLLFGIALKQHEKITIEQIAIVFLISLVFPFAFTTLIYIRDKFDMAQGLYYTLLIFACAWGADSGAYFAGRFFGKRKLAPKISPNKTVEGLIGGLISSVFFVALVTATYYFIMQNLGVAVIIHYIPLLFISIFGALVGVVGDLTASLIKRQCAIKDYGTIMPGHGGILDRFDSVLFITPFFFVVLQYLTCVS